MARNYRKIVKDLNKGFVTEFTALSYPEGAATDMLNIELMRDKSLRRRRGIQQEAGYSSEDGPGVVEWGAATNAEIEDMIRGNASTFKWKSVGGNPDIEFIVIQLANRVAFYDANVSPVSQGFRTNDTIDMTTYAVDSTQLVSYRCQFATGRGKLFIVHPYINPIYVTYDSDANTLTPTQFDIKIRDLEGLDDGLEVNERPTTLSDEHRYNLRNQGWVSDAVQMLFKLGQSSNDPIVAFNQYFSGNFTRIG